MAAIKSRKHRVVVEVTFDRAVNAKDAVWLTDHALTDGSVASLRYDIGSAALQNHKCKQFDRVFQAEQRRAP